DGEVPRGADVAHLRLAASDPQRLIARGYDDPRRAVGRCDDARLSAGQREVPWMIATGQLDRRLLVEAHADTTVELELTQRPFGRLDMLSRRELCSLAEEGALVECIGEEATRTA